MAPGPHIKIEEKEGLLLEQASNQTQTSNDDEDFTLFRYYESNKILGKLYRAVDEHDIFRNLRKYRKQDGSKSMLLSLWELVSPSFQEISWQEYLPEAQSIRNTYA